MNTPDSTKSNNSVSTSEKALKAAAVVGLTATIAACRKDSEAIFELNDVQLANDNANKDKQKTTEQFVSILYTNLFQQSISSNQLYDLNLCMDSVGDKELAREVLISNFFNTQGVSIPSIEEMNANLDGFIADAYARFFVRIPSEAEKTWIKEFIQGNAGITPELVYFAFVISNEYQFY
jgi:hypothetical protein